MTGASPDLPAEGKAGGRATTDGADPHETVAALQTRMRRTMPQLPHRLAAAARFVIDHPDDVVISSMREVASLAGVAPATLVRLARAVGHADWSSLREVHARSMRTAPARYAHRARAMVGTTSERAVGATFSAQMANLDYTATANTAEAITEAARVLAGAERIFVSAFMSCRGPGLTFTYLCKMLRANVELLGGEGSSLVADLATLQPGDAVLAINFEPYGREIDLVADAVARSGCRLVCIADSAATPLSAHATTTLLFSADTPSFFPSIAAAVALVENLAASMLTILSDAASDRVQTVERQLYASGVYRGPAPSPSAAAASKPSPGRETPPAANTA